MKAYTTSQILSSPVYTHAEPVDGQLKKVFYLSQQQQHQQPAQYFPQFIYTEPKAVYSQASPVYADLYARSPAFLQDNTINGHGNQYSKIQQFYIPTTIDEQLVKLLQQSKIRVSSQEHAKVHLVNIMPIYVITVLCNPYYAKRLLRILYMLSKFESVINGSLI